MSSVSVSEQLKGTPVKTDIAEQAPKTVLAVTGVVATLGLQDISLILGICVAAATLCYVTVQLLFLLRKWWLLEKAEKLPSWDTTK